MCLDERTPDPNFPRDSQVSDETDRFLSNTPAPPGPSAKPCYVCGRDTQGRKRMKDHQGRYFCYECGIIHTEQERRTRGQVPHARPRMEGEACETHYQSAG